MNLMVGTHKYTSPAWKENYPLRGDYVCEKCKVIYTDEEIRRHKCPKCGEWLDRIC